jgi:type II secretory pathway component HofQ
MSRRRIVIVFGFTLIAVSLAIVLPGYFSPVPALVAELQSCIERVPDEQPPEFDPTAEQQIVIGYVLLAFNATRAGTTILADRDDPGTVVCGRISDSERFRAAWLQLQDEGCIETTTMPQVTTVSGQNAVVNIGQTVGFATRDGGSVAATVGTELQTVATVAKDGRIHLRLRVSRSDPKEPRRPQADANGNPEVAVAEARASLVLRRGETGIVGGAMRRCKKLQEYRLPLASDLPVIGGCCRYQYEAEIDEETVILVTPKLVIQP